MSKAFDNEFAKRLIHDISDCIKTSEDETFLWRNLGEITQRYDVILPVPSEKFLRINFKVSQDEIDYLRQKNIITKEKYFGEALADGLAGDAHMTPLEKILYAMLWKNGDLGKEQHIIKGIEGESFSSKNTGPVFFEFGKYISNKVNHIFDQHTLRFVATYYSQTEEEINAARKIDQVSKKLYEKWIDRYCDLMGHFNSNKKNKKDFSYHADRILFGAGKLIKVKK